MEKLICIYIINKIFLRKLEIKIKFFEKRGWGIFLFFLYYILFMLSVVIVYIYKKNLVVR